MGTIFRAAKQNRIFQDVVDQIQEAIIDGRLKVGDMLPAERELKDMLKISRGTLREALRVLEQKGLIEIKLGVGGGAMVRDINMEPVSESLGLLIRSRKVSLNHLAEFRAGIEGTVASIAAQRATEKDIETLENLLVEAKTFVDAGAEHWKDFVQVDKNFHQTLSNISGNPLYIITHQLVHDNIQQYYDIFLPGDKKRLEENYQDLAKILGYMKQGDTEGAREQAKRHVRRFNEYMLEEEQHR